MKKSVIYEFDPVIYPTRLWVTKQVNKEDLVNTFYFFDANGEVVDNPKLGDNNSRPPIATTYTVAHIDSHWLGNLVKLVQPKLCGVGVCAHEASHCTDFICDKFGIKGFNYDEGEARAYLVQWVANCINSVLVGRPKDMNGVELEI